MDYTQNSWSVVIVVEVADVSHKMVYLLMF